jgi:DNA primase
LIDSESLKEEVRRRSDLAEVVAEHVALRRTGRELVGLCPFHADRTPSLRVSPAKQIFKCFACGKGGDVFAFVMGRERVTFVEAMRILAERAGIDLSRYGTRTGPGGSDRADLARVNAWAATQFAAALADPDLGREARAYVLQRGISPEMQERFAMGLAPDSPTWLLNSARKAGIAEAQLRAAGLTQLGMSGETYCVFRGRLMFPIRDSMNRVIGFGGRTLKNDKAKYMNTPQNALFDKGRNLFGVDLARQAMGDTRQALVVEGYTDCIAAHQFGFTNTVATLGTALTDDQVGLLRRWSDELVLVFDSDAAGREAADRACTVALRFGLVVKIAHVPEQKDPCDFLQAQGPQAFADVLKSAADALGFKWHRMSASFAADTPTGRREALQAFIASVGSMARFGTVDAIQQGLICNQLSALLGVAPEEVHRQLSAASRSRASAGGAAGSGGGDAGREAPALLEEGEDSPAANDAEQAVLLQLLRILINEPGYYADVADVFRPERLRLRRARRIAAALVRLAETVGEFTLAELQARLDDPSDQEALATLAFEGESAGDMAAVVADARGRLEQLTLLQGAQRDAEAVRQAVRDGKEGGEDEEAERLLRITRARASLPGFAPGVPYSADLARPVE